MSQKILTMLQMQNEMNAKVHPQWIEQEFEWDRAIWIECAELMDHHGWKWWKKQSADRAQIRLELVDIWHFGLSLLLQQAPISESLAQQVLNELDTAQNKENSLDFLKSVEAFAAFTLLNKQFSVPLFSKMLQGMNMDLNQLYTAYVGKNVLNFFRQDHGYKEGSYVKVWNGQEDNEHLVEIAEQLDPEKSSFKDDLYQQLKQRYTKFTQN